MDEIMQIIARCAREVLPELDQHVFRPEDRLADLGANSLDRAEIVARTLEALSLALPRTALFGVANIGELAERLDEQRRRL